MNWISVEERLTNVGEVCLLYQTYPQETAFNLRADPLRRTFMLIGGLRWDSTFISYQDQYSKNSLKYVSHWMPLPESPR